VGYTTVPWFSRRSPPCVRSLEVAKRACVLGTGAHVRRAARCTILFSWKSRHAPLWRQPLAYAVPLVCCGLFELPPVFHRRFLGGHVGGLGTPVVDDVQTPSSAASPGGIAATAITTTSRSLDLSVPRHFTRPAPRRRRVPGAVDVPSASWAAQ
jgi:hypothetical protein